MDNSVERPKRFAWLPTEMPGVLALVREKRKLLGDEHVNECWRRGVLLMEPGWFFAREGPLAVGTPWVDAEMGAFGGWQVTSGQAMLIVKVPEITHNTT